MKWKVKQTEIRGWEDDGIWRISGLRYAYAERFKRPEFNTIKGKVIEANKRAAASLQNISDKKKSKVNTTLDEDKNFLKDNSSKMSFNEINCYRVRIEEKEVLDWILKFIEECIAVLSKHTTTENLVKFIKEEKNIDKSVKEYLSDVFV